MNALLLIAPPEFLKAILPAPVGQVPAANGEPLLAWPNDKLTNQHAMRQCGWPAVLGISLQICVNFSGLRRQGLRRFQTRNLQHSGWVKGAILRLRAGAG